MNSGSVRFFKQAHTFAQQHGNQEDSDCAQKCIGDTSHGAGKQGAVHINPKHNILQGIMEDIDVEQIAHQYLPPAAQGHFFEDPIADICQREGQRRAGNNPEETIQDMISDMENLDQKQRKAEQYAPFQVPFDILLPLRFKNVSEREIEDITQASPQTENVKGQMRTGKLANPRKQEQGIDAADLEFAQQLFQDYKSDDAPEEGGQKPQMAILGSVKKGFHRLNPGSVGVEVSKAFYGQREQQAINIVGKQQSFCFGFDQPVKASDWFQGQHSARKHEE